VIATSAPMGFPPIAASRMTDPGVARAIGAALLAMHESTVGREILATLRLDGFTEAPSSLFDGIARLWDRAREAA
jgi:ABC-type phosphate/phosphonate transport system substrate-binding protein